jgi:hypothetical protein
MWEQYHVSDKKGVKGRVFRTLQMHRVYAQMRPGLIDTWGTVQKTGVKLAPHSRLHETRGRFIGSPHLRGGTGMGAS